MHLKYYVLFFWSLVIPVSWHLFLIKMFRKHIYYKCTKPLELKTTILNIKQVLLTILKRFFWGYDISRMLKTACFTPKQDVSCSKEFKIRAFGKLSIDGMHTKHCVCIYYSFQVFLVNFAHDNCLFQLSKGTSNKCHWELTSLKEADYSWKGHPNVVFGLQKSLRRKERSQDCPHILWRADFFF